MLLIFINVCPGAMNRHCIPGLTMSTALTGNFSAEVSGIIKTMLQGLARTHALCQRPGADTEETGRYDLAWKDLCSILNALSK